MPTFPDVGLMAGAHRTGARDDGQRKWGGSMPTTAQPVSCALYSRNPRSCAKDGVEAATGLPAALLHTRPDVRQVLHDDHRAGFHGIHDAAAQNVVAVAPEAVDLPGEAAQMPLGRAGAFTPLTAAQRKQRACTPRHWRRPKKRLPEVTAGRQRPRSTPTAGPFSAGAGGSGSSTLTCRCHFPLRWMRSAVRVRPPAHLAWCSGRTNGIAMRPAAVDRRPSRALQFTVAVWWL